MFCLYVLFNSAKFVADRCAIIRCSHWSVSASFDCNVTGLAISRLAVATPEDGTNGPPTIFAVLSRCAFSIAPASMRTLGEVRHKSLNATLAHAQRLQLKVGVGAPWTESYWPCRKSLSLTQASKT